MIGYKSEFEQEILVTDSLDIFLDNYVRLVASINEQTGRMRKVMLKGKLADMVGSNFDLRMIGYYELNNTLPQ